MWTTQSEVMESPNLKARVICNPASSGGSREPEELHRELEGYDLEWITTGSPGDATEAARSWREGLLIVVGGDGTISEVVNGLGRAGFPEGVTLAILPAGTGNDLAATLAIPEDPAQGRGRVAPEPGEDPRRGPSSFGGHRRAVLHQCGDRGYGGGGLRRRRRRDEGPVGEVDLSSGFARGGPRVRGEGDHADVGRCGAQTSRG